MHIYNIYDCVLRIGKREEGTMGRKISEYHFHGILKLVGELALSGTGYSVDLCIEKSLEVNNYNQQKNIICLYTYDGANESLVLLKVNSEAGKRKNKT